MASCTHQRQALLPGSQHALCDISTAAAVLQSQTQTITSRALSSSGASMASSKHQRQALLPGSPMQLLHFVHHSPAARSPTAARPWPPAHTSCCHVHYACYLNWSCCPSNQHSPAARSPATVRPWTLAHTSYYHFHFMQYVLSPLQLLNLNQHSPAAHSPAALHPWPPPHTSNQHCCQVDSMRYPHAFTPNAAAVLQTNSHRQRALQQRRVHGLRHAVAAVPEAAAAHPWPPAHTSNKHCCQAHSMRYPHCLSALLIPLQLLYFIPTLTGSALSALLPVPLNAVCVTSTAAAVFHKPTLTAACSPAAGIHGLQHAPALLPVSLHALPPLQLLYFSP
jgi:hypothetical protein